MLLQRLVFGLISLSIALAVPMKVRRDTEMSSVEAYTTSITPVTTPFPTATVSSVAEEINEKLWNNFWDNSTKNWKGSCGSSDTPDLWEVAVAGNVISNQSNDTRTASAIAAIRQYHYQETGGYSATTPATSDIYIDDDSQVMWAFTSAYDTTDSKKYLNYATDLMKYIKGYNNTQRGGTTWSVKGGYIASISTVEAALAAVKLYKINSDDSLISFAKYQMKWLIDHLVDPSTGFIDDGMNQDGSLNTGKLTYTIGVAISTSALLSKYDDEYDWQAIAVEFGVRAMGGGKLDTQFYSNGYLTDTLNHSHNFYTGLVDLLQETWPSSWYQRQAYQLFKNELVREGRHLYDQYYESDIKNSSCPVNVNNLLDFASLAQIFNDISKVVDSI